MNDLERMNKLEEVTKNLLAMLEDRHEGLHMWWIMFRTQCDRVRDALPPDSRASSKTVIVLGHDGNELARWKADSK